ncbi:fimbrial biogenesis chaperone [Enterovibrio calviensis]|uniref:fimbrial biogenesis chaperone n=1 Tax=Enterovibrio calviensis TaxID=91359 RepID=UPI000A99EA50|nr:molecular chaperone [Enterovibrio calviensis]
MQILIRLALFVMGLVVVIPSYAYKVQPMIAEMTPTGRGAQMSMRIDNTNDFPLTVEVLPLKLEMNKQGKETLTPADNDLLVIPVTAIIAPGKSQSVTVRYLGEPDIKESQAYRISVRQQNVLRNENDSMDVGLLMRFDTLMNVKPKKSEPKLKIAQLTKSTNDWLVEVENTGTSYGRINEVKWTLKSGGKTQVIEGSNIGDYIRSTLVLPKSKRIFTMKPVEGFNASNTQIELSATN